MDAGWKTPASTPTAATASATETAVVRPPRKLQATRSWISWASTIGPRAQDAPGQPTGARTEPDAVRDEERGGGQTQRQPGRSRVNARQSEDDEQQPFRSDHSRGHERPDGGSGESVGTSPAEGPLPGVLRAQGDDHLLVPRARPVAEPSAPQGI